MAATESKPKAGVMARNDFEWDLQRTRLSRLVGQYKYGFKTDIVSVSRPCRSIVLSRTLSTAPADPKALVDRLSDMLVDWNAAPGRRGIAAAKCRLLMLANMYLMNLDEVVADYNKRSSRSANSKRILSTRWMEICGCSGRARGAFDGCKWTCKKYSEPRTRTPCREDRDL